MLRKVIYSVFTVYQLSSGNRILLQQPPASLVPEPPVVPAPVDPAPIIPEPIIGAPEPPAPPIEPVTPPEPPIVPPFTPVEIPPLPPVDPATLPVDPVPVEPVPVDPIPVEPPAVVDPVLPVDPVPPIDPAPVNPTPIEPAPVEPVAPVDPVVQPPVDPVVQPPIDPVVQPPVDPVPVEPVAPIVDPIGVAPVDPVVSVLPPEGYMFGAFGQLCPLTPASKFNKCVNPTDIIIEETAVWCDRDADCCMCGKIECGPKCNRLYAGDSGLYGVQDIIVTGSSMGNGALIDCHGVEGCMGAKIIGTNIDAVDCNGDKACSNAHIIITDPKPGFMLDCAGIAACDGLKMEIEFSGPPHGYMCDPSISIKNIYQLSGLDCANNLACHDVEITINNKGCDKVVLQNVECIQPGSCNGAKFDLIGDIDIQNCQCGPSCANAIGLQKCFQNLDRLLCPDPNSCYGQTKEIVNPANGFRWECGNEQSCQDGDFTITLNQDISKPASITRLESIILGGMHSGRNAKFTFNNDQGIDPDTKVPIILQLQRVECGGYGACNGLTVIKGENMFIGEFICAAEACYNCLIKVNELDPGYPCDPNQLEPPTPAPAPLPAAPVSPVVPVVPIVPAPLPVNPILPNPSNPNLPPGIIPINPNQPIVPSPPIFVPVQPIMPPPAPADPVPVAPVQPWAVPVIPAQPVPVTPVAPAQPANPVQPVNPTPPQQPVSPSPPMSVVQGPPILSQPQIPALPANPQPVAPQQPVQPINPTPIVPPQQPVIPEPVPATNPNPVQPAQPLQPGTPQQPQQPQGPPMSVVQGPPISVQPQIPQLPAGPI